MNMVIETTNNRNVPLEIFLGKMRERNERLAQLEDKEIGRVYTNKDDLLRDIGLSCKDNATLLIPMAESFFSKNGSSDSEQCDTGVWPFVKKNFPHIVIAIGIFAILGILLGRDVSISTSGIDIINGGTHNEKTVDN